MPKAARNKARRPLALAANCVFSEDPPTVIATNLLRKPTFESFGLSPWNSELFSFSKPSLAPSLIKRRDCGSVLLMEIDNSQVRGSVIKDGDGWHIL